MFLGNIERGQWHEMVSINSTPISLNNHLCLKMILCQVKAFDNKLLLFDQQMTLSSWYLHFCQSTTSTRILSYIIRYILIFLKWKWVKTGKIGNIWVMGILKQNSWGFWRLGTSSQPLFKFLNWHISQLFKVHTCYFLSLSVFKSDNISYFE